MQSADELRRGFRDVLAATAGGAGLQARFDLSRSTVRLLSCSAGNSALVRHWAFMAQLDPDRVRDRPGEHGRDIPGPPDGYLGSRRRTPGRVSVADGEHRHAPGLLGNRK